MRKAGITVAAFAVCVMYSGLAAQHAEHEGKASSAGTPADTQRKIQQAMRAAPPEISAHAAVMDWPAKEGMPMKPLRAGTNGWMCMPSTPGQASMPGKEDPMCADKNFAALLDAYAMKKDPTITAAGVAYMLRGDMGVSNTDPFAMKPTPTNQWVVSPPHVMLVLPNPQQLDAFPSDPNAGGPWVMWKGTKYAHLMIPTSSMPKAASH